jgi:hypothetical protein
VHGVSCGRVEVVKPAQRYAVLKALEDFFVPLSEPEADMILKMAGTSVVTPEGWGGRSEAKKRQEIQSLLNKLQDDIMLSLMEFVPESKRISFTEESVSDSSSSAATKQTFDGRIFVVHGRARAAVVLLTGDDEGGVRTSTGTHLRGRQNVIFELGFFFGKLGRNRVAVLLEENVEKPSDIDGLVYISLDQSGAWKQALARELEAIDIPVDRSRIP